MPLMGLASQLIIRGLLLEGAGCDNAECGAAEKLLSAGGLSVYCDKPVMLSGRILKFSVYRKQSTEYALMNELRNVQFCTERDSFDSLKRTALPQDMTSGWRS